MLTYKIPNIKSFKSHDRPLTLDVVCNPHGDGGIVHGLCHPADVHLQAVVRAALRVTLAVARLPTLSFKAPGPWRPRWSDDGTANTVTWEEMHIYHNSGDPHHGTSCLQSLTAQVLLDLSVDAVPREVPTVGHCARVAATWWTLWPGWAFRTRGTL